jgi:hypothetical protein
MKRIAVVAVLVLALGLLALPFFRAPAGPTGFATPDACLEAYHQASLAGDVAGSLECLDEPLRLEKKRSVTEAGLRHETAGVKTWVQNQAVVGQTGAHIDVEMVRSGDVRRVRFHFKQTGGGWRVAAIDPPVALPVKIRYGTHINEVPDD